MTMHKIYESESKVVCKDDKTGLIKEVIIDSAHKEAVKRGDTLQPYGKDEKRFFDTYKDMKKGPDGGTYNRNQRENQIRNAIEQAEQEEREQHQGEVLKRIKGGIYSGKKYF